MFKSGACQRGGGIVTLTAALLCLCATPSRAQIPPGAEAARSQDRLLEQQAAPEKQEFRAPVADALPLQDMPPGAEGVTFRLEGLTIAGSTVYREGELAALYAHQLHKDVSLAFLFNLANAITVKYRNDGYILTRAIVPMQEIRNGQARIEIVEGYVENVVIENEKDFPALDRINDYARNITTHRPVHISQIERYLLMIRDLPGYSVDSLLKPSSAGRGAADLVLKIKFDRHNVGLFLDNFGTKYLGPIQTSLRMQANSVLQSGDKAILRYTGTGTAIPLNQQELRYFDMTYGMPVGDKGAKLSFSGSRIISYPGNILEDLDVKSESLILTTEATYPVIRSRRENLIVGARVSMINASNQLLGDIVADDRLRVARARATYDKYDDWSGFNQASFEASQGFGIFGASKSSSPSLSRDRGEPTFTKFNVDVARLQRLNDNCNLLVGVSAQYSPDRLLSPEEFGIGGASYGRGYDSSDLTGDSGASAKVELQLNRNTEWRFLDSYQPYIFYDVGKVFQNERKSGKDSSLASVGAGVRFSINDQLSGGFLITKPLTRDVEANDDSKGVRAFFSLSLSY